MDGGLEVPLEGENKHKRSGCDNMAELSVEETKGLGNDPRIAAEDDDEMDGEEDDGEQTTGAAAGSKKKRKNKKKKKKPNVKKDGDGVVGTKVPHSRLIGGLTDYYLKYDQTEPPSRPVAELFPQGSFPVGEILPHGKTKYPDANSSYARMTEEEKRYTDLSLLFFFQ